MLDVLREKWEEIKEKLKEDHDITNVSYKTWIQPMEVASVEGDTVTVVLGGIEEEQRQLIDFVNKKYKFILQVTIEEITDFACNVVFVLPGDLEKHNEHGSYKMEAPISSPYSTNLNPKYTFDTFVVGPNNKFAHAASLAVAESPAERYNPLFIYGGVGLGKTHLMHAIANFILRNNPNARVLYVTSEKFTNELIDAIRNKNSISTFEFREKYRNIDVLLIDDIQFIIGKEGTQEEFFHTFNFLHDNQKQIVISSDKPPKAFETLEERLRSRFEMGLPVDISAPDYETRMAILRKKEEMEGYNIDNEILKYIATNIKSNIRELEGALTKITAYSKLYKTEITQAVAEEALKDLISPNQAREITIDTIIDTVSEHFHLKPADIISQKRNKEVVYPRQIAMYLCRDMTESPLQMIGKAMGNRDHTTILHGIEKISGDLNDNENLKGTIEILKKKMMPG